MNNEQFFRELDQLFYNKEIAKVEPFIKETLKNAERECDKWLAVSCLNELGGFLRNTSRFDEAAEALEKAIDYLGQLDSLYTEFHATTLINYATNFNMAKKFDEAIDAYHEAIDIFGKAGIVNDYRIATIYNNVTYMYMDKGDYQTAKDSLMKALEILVALSDREIEIATTYSNMAAICLQAGEFDDALEFATLAVKMFKEKAGDRDVHYSAAVCTLAQVYLVKGEYEAAMDKFTEALKLVERDFGKDNNSYRSIEKSRELCLNAIEAKKNN